MGKKPTTPEAQWAAIVAVARQPLPPEEEVDASDENVSAGLRAMGMDPEAVGKRGRELVEKRIREREEKRQANEAERPRGAEAKEPVAASDREGPRSFRSGPRAPIQFAVAAIFFLLFSAGFVALVMRDTPRPVPSGPRHAPEQPEDSTARHLRDEARLKCASADWGACLARLDRARSLDPAGDLLPDVKTERENATRGLNEERERRARPAPEAGKAPRSDKGPAAPQ
jgi:hypothetical protein